MDRHKKYWMDKTTLLYHIKSLIKYDVGDKVFVFEGFSSSRSIPRVGTIKGINIGYSYSVDSPSPYNVDYQMEETENRVSQDNCRKYDEEIANMVDQYHAFFDALKKGEGS